MQLVRSVPRLVSPVWGGEALGRCYGKGAGPGASIGESWEVWHENPVPEASGRALGEVVRLPLLIKLLDTREALSVQVHPDDEAAARLEGAPNGKAEGWVVLDAEPGARVAYGLRRPLSAEALRERAASGAIADDLAWIEVRAGDVIDVPPGTIHAIGGGLTLYEIQQPSDLTYRLYDYGRGRSLHLEKGVEVARRDPQRPSARVRPLGPGHDELLRSAIFVVERLAIPTVRRLTLDRPSAFTVVAGAVEVLGQRLGCGDTAVVLPGMVDLAGDGVVLVGREP